MKEITRKHPQDWGDCYDVNGEVSHFLWENARLRSRVAQLKCSLDRPILDTFDDGDTWEKIQHNVHHNVFVIPDKSIDEWCKGEIYPERQMDYIDFSNVFKGKQNADIVFCEWIDFLSGGNNNRIRKKLDEWKEKNPSKWKKYQKCIDNYKEYSDAIYENCKLMK